MSLGRSALRRKELAGLTLFRINPRLLTNTLNMQNLLTHPRTLDESFGDSSPFVETPLQPKLQCASANQIQFVIILHVEQRILEVAMKQREINSVDCSHFAQEFNLLHLATNKTKSES